MDSPEAAGGAWPLAALAMPASAQRTGDLQVPRRAGALDVYERPAPGREGEVRAGGEPDQREPGAESARGRRRRRRASRANRAPSAPRARGASARSCSRSSPARKRRLTKARQALAEQESVRSGDERNYARVEERLQAVQGQRRHPPEEHRSAPARDRQPESLSRLGETCRWPRPPLPASTCSPPRSCILDDEFVVRYANPAAENLLTAGARSLIGQPFLGFFAERAELERALEEARVIHWDYSARNVTYVRTGREPVPFSCTVTRIDAFGLGAARRAAPDRARAAARARRAPRIGAEREPRADPQPGARDQEPARRPARIGAAARARARSARSCANTRR